MNVLKAAGSVYMAADRAVAKQLVKLLDPVAAKFAVHAEFAAQEKAEQRLRIVELAGEVNSDHLTCADCVVLAKAAYDTASQMHDADLTINAISSPFNRATNYSQVGEQLGEVAGQFKGKEQLHKLFFAQVDEIVKHRMA